MEFLELTLESPQANLALDEALLADAEESTAQRETLRIWESPELVVVVGRSSRVEDEVDVVACRDRCVPILRRPSGGAAIVAGPGCLMYSVVLNLERRPHLRAVDAAHCEVLGQLIGALKPHLDGVEIRGTSDLAIGERKFSGNSLRVARNHLLYHGTLMYDFPIESITSLLRRAPREPDYRRDRDHANFVTNVALSPERLCRLLAAGWNAKMLRADWPRNRVERLVNERYADNAWNFRH